MAAHKREILTSLPSPRRAFVFLAVCIATLLGLHVLAVVLGRHVHQNPYAYRFINIDSEVSVGTWFAQTQLLMAALLLGVIGLVARRTGDRWSRHWIGLALLGLYLSIDEGSALHEQATPVVRRVTGLSGGVFGPAWVVAAVVAGLVLALVYLRFMLALPRRTRNLVLMAAAISAGGAIGAEIVNVVYASARGTYSVGYQTLAGAEEALEKLGVSIVIVALLDHIGRHVPSFFLAGGRPGPPDTDPLPERT